MNDRDRPREELIAQVTKLREELARLRYARSPREPDLPPRCDVPALYDAIIHTLDDHIYVASPDYRIEFVNDQVNAGKTGEIVGEECYRLLYGLSAPCSWCMMEKVLQGETVRYEVRSPKSGQWFSAVQSPVTGRDGRVSTVVILRDISGSKLTEEALAAGDAKYRDLYEKSISEEEMYRSLLNSSPDAIVVYDLRGESQLCERLLCTNIRLDQGRAER